MARRLKTFDFNSRPGRPPKYAWDEWFSGDPWELKRDTDFTIDPRNFRAIACAEAKRRGLVLRTKVVGSTVVIQVAAKAEAVA